MALGGRREGLNFVKWQSQFCEWLSNGIGNPARISQADSCRHGLSEVARGRFRAAGGALGLGDMEQETAGAPQPKDDNKPDLRACQGDQAESGRH